MSDLLDVRAVMDRYRIADRRAARRLMDAAGAFKVAGRLLVHAERLHAHEERLIAERATPPQHAAPAARTIARTSREPRGRTARAPLPPNWWRTDPRRENLEPPPTEIDRG